MRTPPITLIFILFYFAKSTNNKNNNIANSAELLRTDTHTHTHTLMVNRWFKIKDKKNDLAYMNTCSAWHIEFNSHIVVYYLVSVVSLRLFIRIMNVVVDFSFIFFSFHQVLNSFSVSNV